RTQRAGLEHSNQNSDHHLYKPAGSSLTVGCSFKFSGQRKSFCRGECEGDKILVETDGDRGQRGRCRIGYREGRFPVSSTFVYVTIEQLTRSDSGQYRCYLDRFLKDGFIDFRVTVIDGEFSVNFLFFMILLIFPSESHRPPVSVCRHAADCGSDSDLHHHPLLCGSAGFLQEKICESSKT
uniref:Immunoglobulin subtype domain-containing protein n=1 Tax=Kryptolebias marmoratus TaxID=37003 RepID=A0A3Q3FCX3_KRYMA